MDEFKDRIKELRLENDLTQSQLAVKTNRGEATIRAWETGRAKPDAEMLISLSKIFNCTVDYLLGISAIRNSTMEGVFNSNIFKLRLEAERLTRAFEGLTERNRRIKNDIEMYNHRKSKATEELNEQLGYVHLVKNKIIATEMPEDLKEQFITELDEIYTALKNIKTI